MKELLIVYKQEILNVISMLLFPFSVFLITLSFVYISGRMLNILKSNTLKNLLALICLILIYVLFYFKVFTSMLLVTNFDYLLYFSLSVLLYVWVGFSLYERVNKIQDILTAKLKKSK